LLSDAIELLDRQVAFVLKQQEAAFFVQLPALIEALHADPRLVAAWQDTLTASEDALTTINSRRATLAAELIALRRAVHAAVPGNADTGSTDDDSSFATFDQQSRQTSALKWSEGLSLPKGSDPLAFMVDVLEDKLRADDAEPPNDALFPLRLRLGNARACHEHLRREYELKARTLPGVSLARFASAAKELNPEPGVVTPEMDFGERLALHVETYHGRWHEVRPLAFEQWWNAQQRETASPYISCLRADIERVHEELRRRLGLRRSLRGIVDRYAARAMWHDAPTLRVLAAKTKRKAEELLTADFARYLHDQGLNPLTKAMTGGLQPDLLDPTTGWTFYAEAKQYADGKARSYLVKGVHQVWDTLGRLRGTPYEVHEAFYVVFRRGGPRFVLPPELRSEGATVFPVLIDIAEASKSGSRQKAQPVMIAEEELLPRREAIQSKPRRRKENAAR
jgi:hypothetical protein